MDSQPTTNVRKLRFNDTVTLGLLLFGLFFGAGNVIFPVKMGQLAGANYLPATLGFVATAAGLPILGIMSSALSEKKGLLGFAAPGGKYFANFFTIALYLTIGPFFAIPRTATVAYEVGIRPLINGNDTGPLLIYSLIFFLLVFLFTRKPGRIMDIVGRVLTPLFLILMAILLLRALTNPPDAIPALPPTDNYADKAWSQGMVEGYHTMDALASLAFAIVIMTNIRGLGITNPRDIAKETGKASIITIAFFALLYGGLVFLGASTRSLTSMDDNGGIILMKASRHYFGAGGQFLLAATIAVACLKTAIGLVVSIAETFREMSGRLTYRAWMLIFIGISFSVANFGLDTIIQLSIPVLMFLYPLAIVLVTLWLVNSLHPLSPIHFRVPLVVAVLAAGIDLLRALPEGWKVPVITNIVAWGDQYLPLSVYGLGWLIPATLGGIIAHLIVKAKR